MGYSQDLLVNNLNEFGKARANPYACPPNNLKLSDNCDCDQLTICRDSFYIGSGNNANNLVSVDFNGVTYTTDAPVLDLNGDQRYPVLGSVNFLNDSDKIQEWLEAIVAIMEIDIKIDIYTLLVPADYRVVHYGAFTLDNLTLETSGAADEDRCCDTGTFYQYKLSKEGVMANFIWPTGAPSALANTPYNYTGVPATDEATAVQLSSDLRDAFIALSVPFANLNGEGITVVVDDINGVFVITYWTSSDEPGAIDTSLFALCARKVDYLCDYADK